MIPSQTPHVLRSTTALIAMAASGLVALALVISGMVAFGPSPRRGPLQGSSYFGGPSPVPLGEVSGIAYPCVGVTTLTAMEALPVRVTLSQHGEFIGAETVTGDHHFLMAARPGTYQITSNQYQWPTHFSVVLHPLQPVHMDLPVSCK
jgi:hypothetical protein